MTKRRKLMTKEAEAVIEAAIAMRGVDTPVFPTKIEKRFIDAVDNYLKVRR